MEARARRHIRADFESPQHAPETEHLEDAGRLLCRACGEPITSRAHQTTVEGSHVHRRTNPVGITFTFGCFSLAPGAIVVGPTTDEHSWFAGFVWSFSVCGRCREHLGWFFEGSEAQGFHGLILARLVENEPQP